MLKKKRWSLELVRPYIKLKLRHVFLFCSMPSNFTGQKKRRLSLLNAGTGSAAVILLKWLIVEWYAHWPTNAIVLALSGDKSNSSLTPLEDNWTRFPLDNRGHYSTTGKNARNIFKLLMKYKLVYVIALTAWWLNNWFVTHTKLL